MNLRGLKPEAQPAPRDVARGLQTDLEREIIINDWLAAEMPKKYPLLAQTDKNALIIGTYLAEASFSFDSLNNAVDDLKAKLEWLAAPEQEKKQPVMSEVAKREDGSKPTLDLSSASHTARIRREAEEQRKRDEARQAKELAELNAAVQAEAQRKPEPKRTNIGIDVNSGGLPGMPSHARGASAANDKLPDLPTVSQFKAASRDAKMAWMKTHPGQNPVPDAPKQGAA